MFREATILYLFPDQPEQGVLILHLGNSSLCLLTFEFIWFAPKELELYPILQKLLPSAALYNSIS